VTGLSNDAKDQAVMWMRSLLPRETICVKRYEQLEQIMNNLRHEFNDYLSKWM
jgi:hypothetical protein